MTLQQLRYIIMVAQKGTISEAAKELFISQPSLSNAIKELEKELGIVIFSRTNKGIIISDDGLEFLGYARQVVEQADLLENRYLQDKITKKRFCVSTQHYSFVVNAFVDLVKKYRDSDYEFMIRETRTHEIIEDVKTLKSEVGILYLNEFNQKVINKLLKENNLIFNPLFSAKPHIFISDTNPLASRDIVSLKDIEPYPYLSFEQGQYNSFYFSEEILSTMTHQKMIKVSDRATLFNLLIGLDGYTICTGIISEELNGKNIVAIPLDIDETINIGYIVHKDTARSNLGQIFVEALKQNTEELI
ncbi:LysR family transcriptional regulator [Thomasclavelia sp.]